jgi:Fe-S oxidoreductase
LQSDSQNGNRIIFLSDAFARYIEPETEQAALDALAACGFDVYILPILGAGASFLSKGFIGQARAHAGQVLDLLEQIDPSREVTVVGIEPPEIYALKHDYVDLHPERAEEIQQRAGKVWFLDEFLLRSPEFNELRVANVERLHSTQSDVSAMKVNFHPHCHQRAQGLSPDGLPNGTSATMELLRSCGYEVELMDTGCCGMAGTFGYEAEHYELSMQVGELKLFPRLRELRSMSRELVERNSPTQNGQPIVVASGAACRMQIQQGTGLEAAHPIALIARFIWSGPR